jgi:hypothetical protein
MLVLVCWQICACTWPGLQGYAGCSGPALPGQLALGLDIRWPAGAVAPASRPTVLRVSGYFVTI